MDQLELRQLAALSEGVKRLTGQQCRFVYRGDNFGEQLWTAYAGAIDSTGVPVAQGTTPLDAVMRLFESLTRNQQPDAAGKLHVHCDADPIECSYDARMGQVEEAMDVLEGPHRDHATRVAMALDILRTVVA